MTLELTISLQHAIKSQLPHDFQGDLSFPKLSTRFISPWCARLPDLGQGARHTKQVDQNGPPDGLNLTPHAARPLTATHHVCGGNRPDDTLPGTPRQALATPYGRALPIGAQIPYSLRAC